MASGPRGTGVVYSGSGEGDGFRPVLVPGYSSDTGYRLPETPGPAASRPEEFGVLIKPARCESTNFLAIKLQISTKPQKVPRSCSDVILE